MISIFLRSIKIYRLLRSNTPSNIIQQRSYHSSTSLIHPVLPGKFIIIAFVNVSELLKTQTVSTLILLGAVMEVIPLLFNLNSICCFSGPRTSLLCCIHKICHLVMGMVKIGHKIHIFFFISSDTQLYA